MAEYEKNTPMVYCRVVVTFGYKKKIQANKKVVRQVPNWSDIWPNTNMKYIKTHVCTQSYLYTYVCF